MRSMFKYAMILLMGSLTLAMADAATAQHAGDIEVTVVNGKITTDTSVYGAELGEAGIPNEIDEPGFDAVPGTFDPGQPVGFNILDALRVWNGSDFNTIANETMTISFSTLSRTTPTTAGASVAGFTLNATAGGEWHRHLIFTLDSPASTGVYLLKLDLFSSGLETSDPFYVVFNQNEDEGVHDAAMAYVESTLVPEPASLTLAALGGLALLARRR